MAFVHRRKILGDPMYSDVIIEGRPDFGNFHFGVTVATSHPPYVFGVKNGSALVHKIAKVELHWYAIVGPNGGQLVRVNKPLMIATIVCGGSRFLTATRSRTCMVPAPDALLCGRCHGEPASFGPDGTARRLGISRIEAGVKLGCVVNGY